MLTTLKLQNMKQSNEKIAMVTAYDYPSAKQAEAATADMILVGDSLGMVVLGYESTTEVTVDDMIHHAKAVRRGAKDTFLVVDMPFMSYYSGFEKAIENATKIFQQTNAQALKLEGGSQEVVDVTKRLVVGGIPVVSHLGLTPQMVNVFGGFKVQANDKQAIKQIIDDAKKLENAGATALVLECIPKEIGKIVTDSISIPTIGIGAGLDCDGQVLVYHDILQYGQDWFPKFVKNYANFNDIGIGALSKYVEDVKSESFPKEEHTYEIKDKGILPK